jgi:hypothetical protein
VIAGSGGGKLITGKHLNLTETSGPVPKKNGQYQKPKQGHPLANLWLTQTNALGLKLPRFAESTGEVKQLIA